MQIKLPKENNQNVSDALTRVILRLVNAKIISLEEKHDLQENTLILSNKKRVTRIKFHKENYDC